MQMVNEPTRIYKHLYTVVDPFFVSTSKIVSYCKNIEADLISNHRLIIFQLKTPIFKPNQKFTTFRSLMYFDENSFIAELSAVKWNSIFYIYLF